ncbi:hypothetical protein BJX62DRAFT_228352 [Aspergillus germanicus]
MQPFRFKLSNDGTVAGVHSIPKESTSPVKYRPLILGLHGTPNFSASIASQPFGVPFVSIDQSSDFYAETGRWVHQYILPTLWAEIGVPNQCNSIVLLTHSLGVMGDIVAAALHAQDNEPLYPLSGRIANGINTSIDENHVLFPAKKKDARKFKPGIVTRKILDLCEHFNAVSPIPEIYQFPTMVSVPVLFSLVEDNPFFVTDEAELEICARAFGKSVHVERVLIRDAPHCMELS